MPVTPPPITPVPTPAPQRGDRDTFSDRVDAFVTWLENATGEFEAVAQNVYDNATIAEGSGDVATVGLGIITDNPFLSNIDNPNAISAFWVVSPVTTGTFPAGGARDGMVINKLYGTQGFQMFQPSGSDELWYRRRTGSAYQPWVRIDAGLPASGGTLTGNLTMASASPTIAFDETDQTGAAGLWRQVFNSDVWVFQKNTAVAGDFSTVATPFGATSAGVGQVNGAIPVQEGTGVGQSAGTIKLGAASGGLKATINTTDKGYFAFSSTNPDSGGTITYANPLTAQAASFTTIFGGGLITANAGLTVNTIYTAILGGALSTLANNGYMQIAGSGGLNMVLDYTNVQARNNGAAATLNLNSLGGLVQTGAGGFATTGIGDISGNDIIARNIMRVQTVGNIKIYLQNGSGTTHGHIQANSSYCFAVANAANSLQTLTLDNSGNLTAAANITANSDERLKINWCYLREDFLEKLAGIVLLGSYERIDTGQKEIGMSAQQVQAFAPEMINTNPETGILSMDYGRLGAVASALLARQAQRHEQEINELKTQVAALIAKVGNA